MQDRFKFRAVMKTTDLCIIVPIESVHNTYYMIDTNLAAEIFEKKYPEKCFFSDFLEIIEKQEYVNQYSNDSDLLITKDFTNLMQGMGSKDKNGKLIYEGDILSYEWLTQCFAPFIWRKDKKVVKDIRKDYVWVNNTITDEKSKNVEIIGNIYENPEILKGSE